MSALVVVPPLALWAAVVARTPRLADAAQRPLWWGLLCCALASTLNVPAVAALVDVQVALANVGQLLKHGLVIVAAWQSYEVVRGLAMDRLQAMRGRTWRGGEAAFAVALLAALFLLSPADDSTSNFTAAYSDEPVIGAYWIVFLGALGLALVSIGRRAWWYRHSASAGGLRTGMTLVSVGVSAGLAYVVLKVVYVAARLLGTSAEALAGPERVVTPALLAVSILAIVGGVTWPAASERWPLRQVRAAYQHARLRRLWREVTAAVPEVLLERAIADGVPAGAAVRRLAAPHEAELLLFRRMVEILDGLLVLDQYVTSYEEAAVRRFVERSFLPRRRDAVAQRALLELALSARASGAGPASPRHPSDAEHLTPMQEVHRLRALDAARGAAHPIVAAVTALQVRPVTGHSAS